MNVCGGGALMWQYDVNGIILRYKIIFYKGNAHFRMMISFRPFMSLFEWPPDYFCLIFIHRSSIIVNKWFFFYSDKYLYELIILNTERNVVESIIIFINATKSVSKFRSEMENILQ